MQVNGTTDCYNNINVNGLIAYQNGHISEIKIMAAKMTPTAGISAGRRKPALPFTTAP